jgi:hypothetical protein
MKASMAQIGEHLGESAAAVNKVHNNLVQMTTKLAETLEK